MEGCAGKFDRLLGLSKLCFISDITPIESTSMQCSEDHELVQLL